MASAPSPESRRSSRKRLDDRRNSMDPRRAIPSVNALLDLSEVHAVLDGVAPAIALSVVREAAGRARRDPGSAPRDAAEWGRAIHRALDDVRRASLRPLLNGTGVVLHTNLGRAPLSDAAIRSVTAVAAG